MIAAEASVHAPPLALLVGVIAFLCGAAVGSITRSYRTPQRIDRRWVQPRHDIDRSRR